MWKVDYFEICEWNIETGNKQALKVSPLTTFPIEIVYSRVSKGDGKFQDSLWCENVFPFIIKAYPLSAWESDVRLTICFLGVFFFQLYIYRYIHFTHNYVHITWIMQKKYYYKSFLIPTTMIFGSKYYVQHLVAFVMYSEHSRFSGCPFTEIPEIRPKFVVTNSNFYRFLRPLRIHCQKRKHSSRMRTDQAVTRPSSEWIAMRLIVDRQTPVKTLPSPCGR